MLQIFSKPATVSSNLAISGKCRTKWGFGSLGKSLEILPYKWRFSSLQKASKYGCGIFQHESNNKTKEFKSWRKFVDPKNIGLMNQNLRMLYFFRFIALQGSSNKSSWSDSASDADLGPLVAHGSWAHPQARQEFTVAILFRLDLMPQGTNEGVQGSQIDDRHLWFHSRAGNSMFESQGKSSEWGSQLFQFIDGDSEFNSSNRNQSWV